MHVLKRIELLGFKSFADRSVIELGEGTSAIVGPNGCGKSNIVDALRWALGEGNSRALRADRMEGVIFDGTETRTRLGVAEVTIVLNNDPQIVDLPVTEVAVKRRLYRSGESEYTINGKTALLRDVRDLFSDTGLGRTAYSIMEQGRIDQILSSKPEDRRGIFEEAAGITRFRQREVEARRKLTGTDENIKHVEGILKEVASSYDTLRVQAQRAEEYRTLRQQSFELERDLQLLRLGSLIKRRDQLHKRRDELHARRATLQGQIKDTSGSMQAVSKQMEGLTGRSRQLQEQRHQIELSAREAETQITVNRERIGELELAMQQHRRRDEAVAEKIVTLQKALAKHQAELEEVQHLQAKAREATNAAAAEIEQIGTQIKECEVEITARAQSAAQHEQEVGRLRDQLRHVTDDIVTRLDQRLRESGYSREQRAEVEAAMDAELSQLLEMSQGRLNGERLRTGLAALQEHLGSYRQLVSSVIDEFLASNGLVTRKREIDESLSETLWKIAEDRRISDELRTRISELGDHRGRIRDRMEGHQVQFAQAAARRDALAADVARVRNEISEQEAARASLAKDEQETASAIEGIAQRVEDLDGLLSELVQKRDAIAQEAKGLQEEISKAEHLLSRREADARSMQDRLETLRSTEERVVVDLAEVGAEIGACHRTFEESHSQSLSDYEDRIPQITATTQDMRAEVSGLKEQQRALGQINLLAPEQFAEVKERHDFLTQQLADLRRARDDLQTLTKEIRTESVARFMQAYEAIDKNFQKLFHRLFSGGQAELRLTDRDNVLESGVEIFARPPGKQLENIGLLSGGERSMTAIGLMFATYLVRPSPFCVMDEIDAALDEENVGRVVELLHEFSTDTQFLVVTHNKRTVASAANLLGVTMEEPGISRLVSVRVQEFAEASTTR